MTQNQVATELDVTPGYISKRMILYHKVQKICCLFLNLFLHMCLLSK
ncbi:hypothetical protein [Pseudobutyrivibrio sp. OR37]